METDHHELEESQFFMVDDNDHELPEEVLRRISFSNAPFPKVTEGSAVAVRGLLSVQKTAFSRRRRLIYAGLLIASGSEDDLKLLMEELPSLDALTREAAIARLVIYAQIHDVASRYTDIVSDWEIIGAELEGDVSASLLRDMQMEKTNVPLHPTGPLQYVDECPQDLLCISCKQPASEPAHTFSYGEKQLIFCAPCLAAEIGQDPSWYPRGEAQEEQLRKLLVLCPFCGAQTPRGDMQHHLKGCSRIEYTCPLSSMGCPFREATSFHELMDHYVRCNYAEPESLFFEESRGGFTKCSRQVMQLIISWLCPADAHSLSQTNSWFREQVLSAHSRLNCSRCGFVHGDEVFMYHPGKWGGHSYSDKLFSVQSLSAINTRDKMKRGAAAVGRAGLIGAVGIFACVGSLVVAVPLFAIGVVTQIAAPIVLAATLPVKAVKGSTKMLDEKFGEVSLTRWSCCNRQGSWASPCTKCTSSGRKSFHQLFNNKAK